MAGGKPIQNTGAVPAKTALSEEISKALKKRGFKFVGPVIVYAWMQAVGMVNDHAAECFRRSGPYLHSRSKRVIGEDLYDYRKVNEGFLSSHSVRGQGGEQSCWPAGACAQFSYPVYFFPRVD